jgi:ankyrin repeat protein
MEQKFVKAAEAGDLELVEAMIIDGIDVKHSDSLALRIASLWSRTAVVEKLIESGADANSVEGQALRLAASGINMDLVRALLPHTSPVHVSAALCEAVSAGNVEMAKALLDAGADPNTRAGFCMRRAMYLEDRDEMLTMLVDHGANPLPAQVEIPYAVAHFENTNATIEDEEEATSIAI